MSYAFTTNSYYTASDGGLTVTRVTTSAYRSIHASPAIGVGAKLYWEFVVGGNVSRSYSIVGLLQSGYSATYYLGATYAYGYSYDGRKVTGYSFTTYGDAWTDGDVIGVAVDMKSSPRKIWFSRNGVWQGGGDPAAGTGAAFSWTDSNIRYIGVSTYYSGIFYTLREAAENYSYPAPDGFKVLLFEPFGDCEIPLTLNVAAGAQGDFSFNAIDTAWSGAHGSYAIPFTVVGFTPAWGDFQLKQLAVTGQVGARGEYAFTLLSVSGYTGLQGDIKPQQPIVSGNSGAAGTVRLPVIRFDGQALLGPWGDAVITPGVDAWSGGQGPVSLPKVTVDGDASKFGDYRFIPTVDAVAAQRDSGLFSFLPTVTSNAGGIGNFSYSYNSAYNFITSTGHQTYTYTDTILDESGAAAACTALAFSETDHSLVGSTTTDPVTGAFSITVDQPCYLVCLTSDPHRNAITIARGEVYV